SFPFDDDEDNSPAEEVSPVRPKKPPKHATTTKKDDPKEGKEAPKERTVAEEIALCQGCDRAKAKKKAVGSSHGGSSSFVDLVANKFFNMKQKRKRRTRNNSPI
nr:hypothetical protein [Tanacetum cinerariifolium]